MLHPFLSFAVGCLFLLCSCGQQAQQNTSPPASSASASVSTDAGSTGPQGPSSDPYPLETCPVSGEPLDSMGGPIVHQQPGREVKLCCDSCVAVYDGDSDKFNAEIDAEIVAAQKPDYPLDTCLVSGNVIGASDHMVPSDHVVGNRLYRLCCDSCVKALEKDLPKYRAELIAATK